MKIAIVTDSTAYLTPEERREWNIHVLPLSVIFGQESYREEQDLTTADFYEKVKNSEVFPTSSQPAVGETIELFRELSHHYDAIIPILLSSGISGTYQTVVTVAEELQDEVLIYPIDSGISCAPQARAVRLAAMMAKDETYTAKEIVACVQQLVDRTTAYFIVDDLNNLQRGGRLSAGAALVGSMLKIKPILTFEDKKIVAMEKIRTQHKAMKRIEQIFEEDTQTTDGDGYECSRGRRSVAFSNSREISKIKNVSSILWSSYWHTFRRRCFRMFMGYCSREKFRNDLNACKVEIEW